MRRIAVFIDGPWPRAIIFFLSLSLFGFGVRLAFLDKSAGAAAVLGAGILCLIFVFIPSFKRQ